MRSERYRGILPLDRLQQSACTIVGVGAIGRQVALQLAAMGVGTVQLIDHDSVEAVNLGSQGYRIDDLDKPKVDATADMMRELNLEVVVETEPHRFARSMSTHQVVFSCVDSIDVRRHIWNVVRVRDAVLIDGRMAAEVMRVITVTGRETHPLYEATLFRQEEAFREGCTARSTLYCANIAAGMMVSHFTQWLRGMTPEFDVTLNLLATELTIASDVPPRSVVLTGSD